VLASSLVMTDHRSGQGATLAQDPYDFSVVLGGPLYQLVRRAQLSGDALELLRRRVIVISLFAWLPMLILSVLGGRAWGDAVRVPFLADIEVHARFLLALPLLILAELVVHQRMRPVARQFLERGLIRDGCRARFDAAVASAMRLRNSVLAEVLLIAFVYLVGVLVWRQYIALDLATWYAVPTNGSRRLSLAGWWYVCVTLRCSSSSSSAGIFGCSSGCALSGMWLGASSLSCPRTRIARAASDSFRARSSRSRRCCWPMG
jgi:hypothetical protein